MKKRYIPAIVMAALWVPAHGAAPDGYYNSLEGKAGAELKRAVKAVIGDPNTISYGGSSTWGAFETTDVVTVDGRAAWRDMYSDNVVYVSDGHASMNIEHSVPNSWWGKTSSIDAYKDLFHLNPSDATANRMKSNYPLGEVQSVSWTNGVTTVGTPKPGQGGGSASVFEPLDCYKGDFARAYMYIFTAYDDISWVEKYDWMYDYPASDLTLRPWASELLLRWNEADPVDEMEAARNESIWLIQQNRNPYIDLPDVCRHIWGDMADVPYQPGGEDPDPGPSEIDFTGDFESSTQIKDYVADGWGSFAVAGGLSGWYVKNFSGNNYATCSAYLGVASGGPYENWLVTPAMKIGGTVNPRLSFRTQGAYGCDGSTLEVYALDGPNPSTAKLTKLDAAICTPQPDGAKPVYSDWMPSGDIPLAGLGKTVYIGFRYRSEKGGSGNSATYCVDDVAVKSDKSSGITMPGESGSPSLLTAYADGGQLHILASEAIAEVRVHDIAGRVAATVTVSGEVALHLPAGVYVVSAPGYPPVKVLIK